MRVLVSPASKHGGTAQIGRAIARVLRENGVDVDVTQPEDVRDLKPYAGFIVGSALYMGKWLPAALRFVEDHEDGLRRRPTWLFSSGPLGTDSPVEPIDPDRLEHLLAVTGAREHRLLGGRLELARLSRTDRFVARWVGIEDGDHRDWDAIEAWTVGIAAAVKVETPDDEDFRSSLERLMEVLDREDPPGTAELRNVVDEHVVTKTAPEPDHHLLHRLKTALERFETDHPDLTRAVNDVSYYLSGMGI